MLKKITLNSQLYQIIAIIQITDNTNAVNGNQGYKGTLKGRGNNGSRFRNTIKLIILMLYITTAPRADKTIILSVVPVQTATIPTMAPAISAACGVLNLPLITASIEGK